MGSNGLTSARHDVFGKELAKKYPESFDPLVPESLVYSGAFACLFVLWLLAFAGWMVSGEMARSHLYTPNRWIHPMQARST